MGGGVNPSGKAHAFLLTPAISGDANLDGKVDINDLTKVLTSYNQSTGMSWGTGDFNDDQKVDINDLTIVLANFDTDLRRRPRRLVPVREPVLLGVWSPLRLLACLRLATASGTAVRFCRSGVAAPPASVAHADVFNMPAGQTSLQFVTVGDAGNAAPTRPATVAVGLRLPDG